MSSLHRSGRRCGIGPAISGWGRRIQHDPRSRQFAARLAPPRTVTWTQSAPVLDQFYTGGCTGFALAQCLNTAHFVTSRPRRRYLHHDNALQLYSIATQVDEFPGVYPPMDTGSSSVGVCKAGVRLGYLTEYRHTFSFTEFLSALALSPLIVGTNWYQDMTYPDGGLARPTGGYVGGHEYACIGCNLKTQTLLFVNSWGNDWPVKGGRGRFTVRFDDFARLLADDGDATVPIGA